MYYFTNEIVFRGHPDKICDQIAGACLNDLLSHDKQAHAGIECSIKNNKIWIFGETKSRYIPNYPKIARKVIKDIGYKENFEVKVDISNQSSDIDQGVSKEDEGAGDNGMMFGYATDETKEKLPLAQTILVKFAKEYDIIRKQYPNIFYPDGKAEITGEYTDNGKLVKIKQFTVCYCNCERKRDWSDSMLVNIIDAIVKDIRIDKTVFNPTGKFLLGGPWADSGLTGRKIVVDAYESFAPVGGGSMNGKDPSKVDITGAYMARKIACEYIDKGYHKCNVQLSYAIGESRPLAIYIIADGKNIDIEERLYDRCRPKNMINELNMLNLNYEERAKYGHFN
jgi:S-adenosylmethionine synthetase